MNKHKFKRIAAERIQYLFELLSKDFPLEFKKNILKMIYKIRTKYNIRLKKEEKELFCKFCFYPYENPKIRFRKIKKNKQYFLQKIVICDHCGKESRFTIKNK